MAMLNSQMVGQHGCAYLKLCLVVTMDLWYTPNTAILIHVLT